VHNSGGSFIIFGTEFRKPDSPPSGSLAQKGVHGDRGGGGNGGTQKKKKKLWGPGEFGGSTSGGERYANKRLSWFGVLEKARDIASTLYVKGGQGLP